MMVANEVGTGEWSDKDAFRFVQLFLGGNDQYGVVFLDAEGIIQGWSAGCCAITGFDTKEAIGKSFGLLFTDEDVARELHRHELNSAALLGFVEDERWHLRKDGSRFWGSGITLRMEAEPGTSRFAKIFRDATHLRSHIDLLRNEGQQVRADRSQWEMFVATIAHELRNPVQPIKVAALLLSRGFEQSRQDQALKIINRQVGFLERLIEDLIDMTRVSRGALNLDYRRVQLQGLLQDAVDSCRPPASAKNISVVVVLPPVPIEVEVDPDRINQVVINVLNNAIKFTPHGGTVSLLGNIDKYHFTVKVQDTGIGIPADLQPKIFDMFSQAQGSDTRRKQGLGIGLALAKDIVSLHGGSIEVRSDGQGKGSEFLVRIPLVKPAEPAKPPNFDP